MESRKVHLALVMIGAIFVVKEKGQGIQPSESTGHEQDKTSVIGTGRKLKENYLALELNLSVTLMKKKSKLYKYLWIPKSNCLFFPWQLKDLSQNGLKT